MEQRSNRHPYIPDWTPESDWGYRDTDIDMKVVRDVTPVLWMTQEGIDEQWKKVLGL